MMNEIERNLRAYEEYISIDHDEAGWRPVWDRLFAILCSYKSPVKEAFGLDPRKSILYTDFPELLKSVCDPQLPTVYFPKLREFGLVVFDGGAFQLISFDPWSGKPLPKSLRKTWFDHFEGLGIELWEELEKVPEPYKDETWWKDSYVSGVNA